MFGDFAIAAAILSLVGLMVADAAARQRARDLEFEATFAEFTADLPGHVPELPETLQMLSGCVAMVRAKGRPPWRSAPMPAGSIPVPLRKVRPELISGPRVRPEVVRRG